MEAGGKWYLVDPQYAPELTEVFGEEFRQAYQRRIRDVEEGRIPARAWRVCDARNFTGTSWPPCRTSHRWITFKDTANGRNMLPGVIDSSNLCTEIFLPTSPDEVAVCNLASVNLARHLGPQGLDWEELSRTVAVAMRALDKPSTSIFTPSKKPVTPTTRTPVGLGVMGFGRCSPAWEWCTGIPGRWSSPTGRWNTSATMRSRPGRLAQERESFPAFPRAAGPGVAFIDTWVVRRGNGEPPGRHPTLDWDRLRALCTARIRNGALLAIAPTATISLIAGTTPSLDPYHANVFSRQTLSGKSLEINPVLVDELRSLGLWEQVRHRLVEERGMYPSSRTFPWTSGAASPPRTRSRPRPTSRWPPAGKSGWTWGFPGTCTSSAGICKPWKRST